MGKTENLKREEKMGKAENPEKESAIGCVEEPEKSVMEEKAESLEKENETGRSEDPESVFLEAVPGEGEEKGQEPESCGEGCGNFAKDNRGIGVVEIILILVILIGLVLLFQTQIKSIVSNALSQISTGAGKIKI